MRQPQQHRFSPPGRRRLPVRRRHASRAILFLTFLLLFLSVPHVSIAGLGDKIKQQNEDTPWNVTADAIVFDDLNEQYVATGDVIIENGEVTLKADYVRLDHQSMKAYAEGNAELTGGGDILRGSRMEMDLEARTGHVEDGSIFLKENNFHITGRRIEKTGEDTYEADDATVTSCDGDNPDWQLKGKKVNVTIGGYGYVYHASLWTRKLPVVYSPLVVFPAKRKRQTGFLVPEAGVSDRMGMTYIQPFFWAISDQQDATFYAQYMQERGIKMGAEYRYILSEETKGAVMADGFKDRQKEDGSAEKTEKWGYSGDAALRENTDRYWFRMKHDQKLPLGFTGKVDLDVVSDQDYLNDFEDSYMGFKESDKYFSDVFGRDLDEVDDAVRMNRLNLSRYWSQYSLNVEARWYDDVIKRRTDAYETTQQLLPHVAFEASKQQVMDTSFYYNMESSYDYLWSEDGTRGHRTDIHPRLYYPINVNHYFTFEPSVGYHATEWFVTRYENVGSERSKDKTQFRGIYDLKLDLSSELYRIFEINGPETVAIKHTLTPQLVYDYIPDQSQDRYPAALLNEVKPMNRLTWSLTNILTAKEPSYSDSTATSGAKEGQEPATAVPPVSVQTGIASSSTTTEKIFTGYNYDQFCYLKLSQFYDFYEAAEEDTNDYRNGRSQQPFGPLSAELTISPWDFLSLNADASWNFYEDNFETRNVGLMLSDNRGDRLYLEHRYENDLGDIYRTSSESIFTSALLKVYDKLSLFGDYERNIHDSRHIQTTVGLLFTEQCWSIDFRVIDEPDDLKFKVLMNLFGLGEFGN